jgi:hypothetical protein
VYVQRSYLQMRSGDSKHVSTGVQASVKRGLWEPAVLLANAGMPYLVSVIAHFAPLQQSQAVCVIFRSHGGHAPDWTLFSRIYHMGFESNRGLVNSCSGFRHCTGGKFSVGKRASPVAARETMKTKVLVLHQGGTGSTCPY